MSDEAISRFSHAGADITLIGTAHVSHQSVADVERVIAEVKPDVVCVELCQARHDALTSDNAFRKLDIFKVLREGKGLFLLLHLALAAYQRKIGNELGIKPGAELLAGVNAAKAIGAEVALIDRDVNVTLKRTWAGVSFWQKVKLFGSMLIGEDGDKAAPVDAAAIEAMRGGPGLSTMLSDFARQFPGVKGPLIDERDLYLVEGIRQAAKQTTQEATSPRRIVAVVGAAHAPGIKANLDTPVQLATLNVIPPASLGWTILKWSIPALLLAMFAWVGVTYDKAKLGEVLLGWALPTGAVAALFTLGTGGHVLSGIVAFFLAPFAAIHPLIGTAMGVGLAEAYLRKPSVADCEHLGDALESWGGMWRNKVTRILLIAAASGLGTIIGFWIGVTYVVRAIANEPPTAAAPATAIERAVPPAAQH